MLDKIIMEVCQVMGKFLNDEQINTLKNTLFIAFHDKKIEEDKYEVALSDSDEDLRLIKLFRASKLLSGRSDSTLNQYMMELKNCKNTIEKNFKDITTMDLRWYLGIAREQHGNKNSTIQNKIHCLNSFYSFLLNEGIVSSNPVSRIEIPKIEKTIKKSFSSEDMEAIRKCCVHSRDRALIEFLYSTGLRVSELTSLNVNDIDFSRQEFTVIGKGNKERTVYFSSSTKFHLLNYFKWRIEAENITEEDLMKKPLFVELRKPFGRISKEGVEARLRNIGKSSGVLNVYPHRFRRTFATNMAARGMKIEEIAKLMGHSKLETTLIYCNVIQDNIKSSYNKFVA